MAINKVLPFFILLWSSAAGSREAASPAECSAAASRPDIQAAASAFSTATGDLKSAYQLADLWSDAGCFNEALDVLQTAKTQQPVNKELDTRLRVATSAVGEEHFFDRIDRSDAQVTLHRNAFRCANIGDLDACVAALRMRPDDPKLLMAQADALVKAGRVAESVSRYERAATLDPDLASAADKGKLDARAAGPPMARNSSASEATAAAAAAAKGAASAGRAKRATGAASLPISPRYSNAANGGQSH